MSYLANKTRVSSLTVGGVDYTAAFIDWTCSDQSAYKNGCIQTTGSLKLGFYSGGPVIEDYDRDNFKRGVQVILELTEPGGSTYRHPRGLLYVITSSYDIESEELTVQLGCRLTMMSLTEDIDDLIALLPVPLDPAQVSFSNCSAAFSSVGKYIYQDNTGALQTGTFFNGDSFQGVASGQWLSVLGLTALSASPLQGSAAIPDKISLSYQVPRDGIAEDRKGLIETVETDSYYFLTYPAVVFVRKNSDSTAAKPNGTLGNIGNTFSAGPKSAKASGCGNTPSAPTGATVSSSCNEGYELTDSPITLPALRQERQESYYDGPGAQLSRVYTQVRGPAVEANNQYYADQFTYCRTTWGTKCNPNGACPLLGMETILLGYTETIYYYGEANELIRTIRDTYLTTLSAAQPANWRSGISGGIPQDFNPNLSTTELYRSSRTDTENFQEGNTKVQKTTTFISNSNKGEGTGGSLDALDGIKTVKIRRSSSNTTLDISPDIVNSATTETKQESTTITLFTGRFKTPPDETGPYILEEQIPVPLLLPNQAQIDAAVVSYEDYITRFVKGDSFGIQVGEAMRSEVATGWEPGMPFRYFDPKKNKLFALRMDATTWGVSRTESAFVTNGIWIGTSNGTVVLPENILGDSKPDMGGGITPPSSVVNPAVNSESSVDSGTFSWDVDVFFSTDSNIVIFGNDGVLPPPPSEQTIELYRTFTVFVEGLIVGPGDLLETSTGGSIPVDLNGSLVVDGATVVDADIFS